MWTAKVAFFFLFAIWWRTPIVERNKDDSGLLFFWVIDDRGFCYYKWGQCYEQDQGNTDYLLQMGPMLQMGHQIGV